LCIADTDTAKAKNNIQGVSRHVSGLSQEGMINEKGGNFFPPSP
jgi:predicted transcriptional regulator